MDSERRPCIVVPRDRVEEVRKKLSKEGALDRTHRIDVVEDTAFLPIMFEPEGESFPIEEHICKKVERRIASYKELLSFEPYLMEELPSSYDVVGTLAVIRLPDVLLPHAKEVGQALLEFLPSVGTVLLDKGVEGEWRIRQLDLLAGEDTTKTLHKEYGVEIVVDLSKAYFSPRLASEHWRIADMVNDDEIVLDLFTGVGPFPLVISKHKKPKEIVAVDINPGAISLLQESIELNGLERIRPVVGDAREIAKTMKADRIIMNLPHGAKHFLESAKEALADGGTIHYHEIVDTSRLADTKRAIERLGLKIISQKDVRTYAPGQVHYAFDICSSE